MSFWNLSDANEKLPTGGTFEADTGIEPMPEGTQVVVMATEAKWDEYEESRYISLTWDVIEGEYKNRKVFQKVRVNESDTKKRDKAIKMLAAIDSNTGGGLMRLGAEPSDIDLSSNLLNKPMALKLGVWDWNGKTGNLVRAVSPVGASKPAPAPSQPADAVGDDDIPF